MSDRLTDLKILSRVAHRGSFSAAAREFGLTQPAVSRAIVRLEAALGVPLLTRTTRAVSLTEAGAAYLAGVEPALSALDEAEQAARGSDALRGTVRVALSSSVAVRELIPALPSFTARHPEVGLVLMIHDGRRRLVEDGVDLSLRLGPLDDTSMVARLVARWPFDLFASPGYIAAAGTPQRPDDLRGLAAIYHSESPTQRWVFRKGRAVVRLAIPPRHVINSQEGCIAAAKAGLGYIYSAPVAVRDEVGQGTLVRLLPGWDLGSTDVSLIFPAGRAATRATRALADFISSHFGAVAPSAGGPPPTPAPDRGA